MINTFLLTLLGGCFSTYLILPVETFFAYVFAPLVGILALALQVKMVIKGMRFDPETELNKEKTE